MRSLERLKNLCFIEENHKTLTNEQMARELGIQTKCVIKYKRELGIETPRGNSKGCKSETKCWDCKYATKQDECIWVRTLIEKPKGCEIAKNGDIKSCPQFVEG